MGDVRRILLGKPSKETLTTGPTTTVFEAIGVMAEHGVGALVVTREAAIVGIVTERDYLRKVALQGRSSRETPVSEIMSSPVHTVGQRTTIEQCLALMTAKRCRHLPVVDERGHLVGVVSIGDCVKQLVREQKDEIEFLNQYIGGSAAPSSKP